MHDALSRDPINSRVLYIGEGRLDHLLSPLLRKLNKCFWSIGGAGASPRDCGQDRPDSDEWQKKWAEEYGLFVQRHEQGVGRVGLPGWFARYGCYVDADWCVYFVSDSAEFHIDAFAAMADQRHNWFGFFHDVPKDICMIVRCIDSGYWEFFFRDEDMFRKLETSLSVGLADGASWYVVTEKEFIRRMMEIESWKK